MKGAVTMGRSGYLDKLRRLKCGICPLVRSFPKGLGQKTDYICSDIPLLAFSPYIDAI